MIKSIIAASLCSFIVLFFTGWIFDHYIADAYFSDDSNYSFFFSDHINDVTYFLLGLAFQAISLSWIYYVWYSKQDKAVASGIKFGLFAGFFVGFGIGFVLYGTSEISMSESNALLYALWKIIHYVLGGLAIGLAFDVTEAEKIFIEETDSIASC